MARCTTGSLLRRRIAWTLLFAFLLLPEIALLGYFSAGAVLSSPASLPHRADVVVVLGGGDGARYERGRDLVLAGYADRLIVFVPSAAERQDARVRVPTAEFWDDVKPRNSWGEAQAVRGWMKAKGWKSALVVTDPPHLLRAQYAWGSNFRGADIDFTLVPSAPAWWSAWQWWDSRESTHFVENEVLKMGYYLVRYRFGLFLPIDAQSQIGL